MITALYAKLIGLAAILLVIAGFWLFIHHKNEMIDELETSNKTLALNNQTLQSALDTQNAAVLKLKSDSDAREAAGKVIVAQAATVAVKKQAAASTIFAATAPASSATCEVKVKSTLDLINGSQG